MATEGFAARLRELRGERGWTQAELAQRAGVSERAIAQWEQDIREPSWGNVIALANTLGVSTEAFREPPSGEPAKPKRGRPKKATSAVPEPGGAAEPAKARRKGKR